MKRAWDGRGGVHGAVRSRGFARQGARDGARRAGKQESAMTVRKTWRCFHCDEEFVTTDAARDHFGATGESASACQIKAGAERSLLKELRRVEIELFNLLHQVHNEATETMKAMHSQSGRHQ